MTATSRRTCMFCGAAGPLTLEHVWPAWVGVEASEIVTNADASGAPWGMLRGGTVRASIGLDARGRVVCEACNTGWMSGMEGALKPLLAPMIKGYTTWAAPKPPIYRTTLSAGDQALIAAWAFKTALVIDRVRPSRHIADDVARQFFVSRQPPVNSLIWLTTYGGGRIAFASRFERVLVAVSRFWMPSGIRQDAEVERAAVLLTLRIMRVVIQIVVLDTSDLPALTSLTDTTTKARLIHPPRQDQVLWPISEAMLTDITEDEFLLRRVLLIGR